MAIIRALARWLDVGYTRAVSCSENGCTPNSLCDNCVDWHAHK